MTEYKVGEEVTIPTSYLGSQYGIGKIVAVWSGKIAVDFKGHIGHYTVENHTIHRVIEAFGMKFGLDESVPIDGIFIKY